MTLRQLYEAHKGKVSDKWSLYLDEYERLLYPYKDKEVNVLEIGIQNGGSLEIWADYFKNAHRLVGCDIEKKCGELVYDDERIHIIVGDANSSIAFDSIKKTSPTFDIIIDDGSHRSSDIIKSFMRYFPLLEEGGSYIAEDLHCSYWQEYEGGLFDPYSSLSFFRQLVDVINYEHWGVNAEFEETISAVLSHYNIEPASDFPWQSLHSIEFVNSICVIKKLSPIKSQLGMRKITGQLALVNNAIWAMNDSGSRALEQDHNPRSMSENPLIEYEKTVQKMKAAQEREKNTHRNLEKSKVNIENKNQKIHQQQQQLEKKDAELNELRQHSYHLQAMLDSIINSESWKVTAPARLIGRRVKELSLTRLLMQALHQGGGVKGTSRKVLHIYRSEGVGGLKRGFHKVRSSTTFQPISGDPASSLEGVDRNDYATWVKCFDTLSDVRREQIREVVTDWQDCPVFSVIMPTFNPEPEMLRAAIASVTEQLYPHWELCIADDASTDPAIREILEDYAQRDSRIKVTFRERNGHISASSNSALALAEQDWVVLFDHDDLLTEHALFYMAEAIRENPQALLLYSDEDKINESGQRFSPYFKPDWNRDLFYSHNMICHLGVYKRNIVEGIGGFREGFEGSQDHDLALRFIEQIDESQIHHVPRVLYHWRMHSGSTAASGDAKPYTVQAGLKAINEHFERTGVKGHVEPTPFGYRARYDLPENPPLVSLVVPTRNGLHLVRTCVESIVKYTEYSNYEILLVDNNSDDPDALAYFAELNERDYITVIRDEQPFNYSAINNDAVAKAKGDIIALVNNDIEVVNGEWLTEMVSLALQSGVGAVGAKLYYPNDTLQHAGVVTGVGGVAGHSHKHFPKESAGFMNRTKVIGGYSAITAACLVIRKTIFDEVGGLNAERLKIAFNDVDFCLRIREAGYRNVWTPYADLYHHESVSRGYEDTPEKQARFSSEVEYMKERWGKGLSKDPAYNPNLTLDHEDFSLAWPPRV
nr:glycosyltransferase [uncultured Halomonas sp.]